MDTCAVVLLRGTEAGISSAVLLPAVGIKNVYIMKFMLFVYI